MEPFLFVGDAEREQFRLCGRHGFEAHFAKRLNAAAVMSKPAEPVRIWSMLWWVAGTMVAAPSMLYCPHGSYRSCAV
jgi:hypothetical protein